MIYLPDKAPGETLDYVVDLNDFVAEGRALDSAAADVLAAGLDESPLSLVVVGTQDPVASPCDATRMTAVHFWLQGGTPGVRYRGVISASDNGSSNPDRQIRRQFEIMIRNL